MKPTAIRLSVPAGVRPSAPAISATSRLAACCVVSLAVLALVAAPVSVDDTGLPILKTALDERESGSDGDGGGSDNSGSSHDDDDDDNSGSGSSHDDDDDDNSGSGSSHDSDSASSGSGGHGGGDEIRFLNAAGNEVRIRERDGEIRIRVRDGENDLLRVRERPGETRVRFGDGQSDEDLVRVRLRTNDNEFLVRVRDATTGEFVDTRPISVAGAVDQFNAATADPDIVSLNVDEDGVVEVDIPTVQLTPDQSATLIEGGWRLGGLDLDSDGDVDSADLGIQ